MKSLDDLPPKLRKKIDASDPNGCWLWTGSFSPPAQRFRGYYVPPDFNGFRTSQGRMALMRGTPNVRSAEKGYAVPAYRVVYAECHEIPLDDAPQLGRCTNDRCVAPHHMEDKGPVRHKTMVRERRPPPAPGELRAPTVNQMLGLLKARRPYALVPKEAAEAEMEWPTGSIPDDVWLKYVRWDEKQPDD